MIEKGWIVEQQFSVWEKERQKELRPSRKKGKLQVID